MRLVGAGVASLLLMASAIGVQAQEAKGVAPFKLGTAALPRSET